MTNQIDSRDAPRVVEDTEGVVSVLGGTQSPSLVAEVIKQAARHSSGSHMQVLVFR